jgi:hypothetical protein
MHLYGIMRVTQYIYEEWLMNNSVHLKATATKFLGFLDLLECQHTKDNGKKQE